MDDFPHLSEVLKSLVIEKGIDAATEIQTKAIPAILTGKNALLISPTGSGKTEAVMLPIFDMMLGEGRGSGVSTLYITPLRALNRDLLDRLGWWARRLDFRMAVRHGDTPKADRRGQALAPPDILITTPETLQILLVARKLREMLRSVRHVVVDEVHELADDKRGTQLAISLKRLEALTGRQVQIVGLSATVGNAEEIASFLVGEGRECEIIKAFPKKAFEFRVIYQKAREGEEGGPLFPDVAHRLRLIMENIRDRKSLVFTNTRSEAESLVSRIRLIDPKFPIAIHHGSLSISSRSSAEEGLKAGRVMGVICTSSLELGIDIGDLDIIVQYNSPRQASKLIQRVGRSGHSLSKVSRGIMIVQDSDDALEAAVLANMAMEGNVESINVPVAPLDVMQQQIAGLIMERTVIKDKEVVSLLNSTYPYHATTLDSVVSVINYMSERRPSLVRHTEGAIMRPPRAGPLFDYYFSNLTMIPEEVTYTVIDESGDGVGQLDESFISEYGEIGSKFILAGSAWVITDINRNRVFVKRVEDPAGAIPSWIGEEIPVVKEVAQEVGRVRGKIAGMSIEDAVKYLTEHFPMDEESAENAVMEIELQVRRGLPVPSDSVITVEGAGTYVIVHTHLGLTENRTLSRMLAYLVSQDTGNPVKVKSDAYRIILESAGASPEHVTKTIMQLMNVDTASLARQSCEETGIFRRRLIQAARKMGAIEAGKMVTIDDAKLLATSLKGTAIYDEAIRTMMEEDLDWKAIADLMKSIRDGTVKVVSLGQLKEPTPIAMIGLEEMARQGEVVDPARLKRLIIEGAKARAMGCTRTLYCYSCNSVYPVEVYYLGDPPSCSKCGSTDISLLNADEGSVIDMLSGKNAELKARAEKVRALVRDHGKKAAIALCFDLPIARIPETISGKEDDQLFLALMDAERKRIIRRR
ncbi:MAG: DEAD/DEAH box helicase [Nitrososphaerota archaeon]|jgi:ATP-dependent Lhr-like helicase|nr:DEAD/DEAH box helicase [Nitrososphaerota archaeon]MDG6927396.1 DEAD/DEAH box helicase [Nitrososphaerota archaeon]MDG6931200.1 DEAD/DEAH box helicase [Nitrososphaerota archaeon]MDG6931863.1 DEAD/DEAH box helicase [Nitrososphaerota archaeon]MDG6936617.1 DEAD/DEAH box helicase [Nitrososphaerota archaeon]